MTNNSKKKNGKLIGSLVLILVAMGVCFNLMRAEINPMMSGWILFCFGILITYFLVIWLKNKFKK